MYYIYGNERNIIITIYILRWYNTYILLANIIVCSIIFRYFMYDRVS